MPDDMEAAALIAAGAAIALTPRAWRWLRPRLRRGRMVECTGCGRELPARRAKRVSETYEHDMGGTAVSTDWHARCLRKAESLT